MPNFPKRKPKPYTAERDRLLELISTMSPQNDDYPTVLAQIDKLDKILNRSSEWTKTVIPAVSTVASVGGIYALQQFGGVIVPKALDTIASRSTAKNHKELD